MSVNPNDQISDLVLSTGEGDPIFNSHGVTPENATYLLGQSLHAWGNNLLAWATDGGSADPATQMVEDDHDSLFGGGDCDIELDDAGKHNELEATKPLEEDPNMASQIEIQQARQKSLEMKLRVEEAERRAAEAEHRATVEAERVATLLEAQLASMGGPAPAG